MLSLISCSNWGKKNSQIGMKLPFRNPKAKQKKKRLKITEERTQKLKHLLRNM